MASAQVLQNSAAASSRKQGHLEAGKRRLEEFRKKKAEGKTKKVSSTGQLLSSDVNNLDRFSQGHDADHFTRIELARANTVSSVTDDITESIQLSVDGTVKEPVGDDVAGPHKDYELSRLMDDYYSQERGNSGSVEHLGNAIHSVSASKLRLKDEGSAVISDVRLAEHKQEGNSEIFQSNSVYVPDRRSSTLFKEIVLTSYKDGSDLQHQKADTGDLASQFHDSESQRELLPLSSSVDSASALKISSAQLPSSSSTSFPTTSWRSRPSFHDVLNIPRPSSSTSHTLFSESKNNSVIPFGRSKFSHPDVQGLSSQKSDDKYSQGVPSVISPHSYVIKDSYLTFPDSKSDGSKRKATMDDDAKRILDFPSSTKDDGFSALEQHIEDLTQEKFSLQRELESSRALAESLASENSSLTESYNQQRQIVNELKSEMERLQEEVKARFIEIEAAKMESANAQLECSAADERAKILVSEVIGLEEKALRLRSNELKLEKQLENVNAEISSYKRKLYSHEKERHDFQSTIEALQEEKKLLLAKVRKTSLNDRVDSQKTATPKKDAFTSTEDLVMEHSNTIDEGDSTQRALSPDVNSSSRNISAFSTPVESGGSFLPDLSSMIPPEHQRMIDNINSLISELSLEKEEMIRELRAKSDDYSKLMNLNKELSQKLERQTQRLEFIAAQHMASESVVARPVQAPSMQEMTGYTDEGDEVVERVLSWIMKLFPGGPSKRRTSKLL